MPHIQIRNVSDQTHETLKRRAEAAGQSLQEYLRTELERMAELPTNAELLEQIEREGSRGTFGLEELVADIRAERGPLGE